MPKSWRTDDVVFAEAAFQQGVSEQTAGETEIEGREAFVAEMLASRQLVDR